MNKSRIFLTLNGKYELQILEIAYQMQVVQFNRTREWYRVHNKYCGMIIPEEFKKKNILERFEEKYGKSKEICKT